MSHLFYSVLKKTYDLNQRISYKINCLRAIICSAFLGGKISIGKKVKFYVPVRFDGQGTVIIKDRVSFGYHLAPRYGKGTILCQARSKNAKIIIGNNTSFSNNVSIIANEKIEIGEKCLIGDGVLILDSDGHGIEPSKRLTGIGGVKPVIVGRNVWIGSRVVIQKGIKIGDNSVIAAMSVVTKDIPANCIAAGVPAKVIKKLTEDYCGS